MKITSIYFHKIHLLLLLTAITTTSISAEVSIANITNHIENHTEVREADFDGNESANIIVGEEFNVLDSRIAYITQTPKNQIRPFEDIGIGYINRSGVNQNNVIAHCAITNPSGQITVLEQTFNNVPPSQKNSDTNKWIPDILSFDDSYTPEAVGNYTARFYTNTDVTNYIAGINEEVIHFSITDDVYSMDNGNTDNLSTVPFEGDMSIGLIIPVSVNTEALSATFALANPLGEGGNSADNLIGETVDLYLYKLDPNGDGNIDENGDYQFGASTNDISDELHLINLVGYESYTISADNQSHQPITVDFINLNSPSLPVTLEGSAEDVGLYFMVLEYVNSDPITIKRLNPTVVNEGAVSPIAKMIVETGNPAIPTEVKVGGTFIKQNGEWAVLNNSSEHPQFLFRLNIAEIVGIAGPQLEDGQVSLSPNPASDHINIQFELTEVSKTVEVFLMDVTGRVIDRHIHHNVQENVVEISTKVLASGTYFVHINTNRGRKTLKLMLE